MHQSVHRGMDNLNRKKIHRYRFSTNQSVILNKREFSYSRGRKIDDPAKKWARVERVRAKYVIYHVIISSRRKTRCRYGA